MNVIKCRNIVTKRDISRSCDRFLMKIIELDKIKPGFQAHVKCHACGNYAIITVGDSGNLNVAHIKEGENEICQKNLKT